MSDETRDSTRDMRSELVLLRGNPGVAHSADVKVRAFELYSTLGARSPINTEKLLAAELQGSDQPVPARQTIATWAREEKWADQADDLWRNTKGWTHDQLRVISLANTLLSATRRNQILMDDAGEIDNDTAAKWLKAGELSDRAIERILPLGSLRPPDKTKGKDEEELPRADREAQARARIVRRKSEESA